MIYTIEEVTEFLKLLEDEPLKHRAFFNLAVFSGFRRSELLGLEWKDVEFENKLISALRKRKSTRISPKPSNRINRTAGVKLCSILFNLSPLKWATNHKIIRSESKTPLLHLAE